MFLTDEEVAELTGRVRRAAQLRALRSMGIEHRTRPDGSIAVLRSHLEKLLGGTATAAPTMKRQEPNWEAFDA